MKLVKVTNEIRFLEGGKVYKPVEELFSDLSKQVQIDKPKYPISTGMRIRDDKSKTIMVVESIRSVIDVEQPKDVKSCKDTIMRFAKLVNERIGIPTVTRYGLRSTWINEYKGSFQELLNLCKTSIFKDAVSIKSADDIGLVLDYFTSKGKKSSATFGPMEVAQIEQQFLSYKLTGATPVFLYTDVDVGDTITKKFSLAFLNKFIEEAVEEGNKITSEISKMVGLK
jgi:hypothetical protein